MYKYYEKTNLNIQQIIDGDLLQVLHAICISGLLQQMREEPEVVRIQDSDNDQVEDSAGEEDSAPTGDSYESDERDDNREDNNVEDDSSTS